MHLELRSCERLVQSYTRADSFDRISHQGIIATVATEGGGDWLPEIKTYMPFDPSANNYLTMMYR